MFIPIVNTSISASWLILAIIVIRLVFKKMPKAWTCVLWGLVAIRLICPFSIESPLSLIPSAEVIPEEVLYMEGGQRHDPVEFNGIEVPTVQETVGEAVGETVSQVQIFDVKGSLVWLAGMAVMLLYALISYLRLRYRVMVSINERDNIWLCDQIDSPFILGMFRPRIYMPSGMAEEQAAYVIAHEQAHLHRHDHWWKPFGFFLLAVYWFNPLIWVAYILLSRDIELACDEKVIQSMATPDKQAYSEALLVCSVNRRMIAACPLAFGEVGVKARVKSVLNYKKPAFWVVVGSVVICAVVAVCFLTDPEDSDPDEMLETACEHVPGDFVSYEWRDAPNPDPAKYTVSEQRWDKYICTQCGEEFEVESWDRLIPGEKKEYPVTQFLSEKDFEDPVATAEKLLSRAFSFDPTNYKSEVSQNGDFWNITFQGEHSYVVELTPKLPYPQTLYEFRRVPPGGYGEVEIPAEGELVDVAEDFLWNAYALKGEDAQIEVTQGEDKICVQFVFSDTAIFHVRIHTGGLKPAGIMFFNNIETAQLAMEIAGAIEVDPQILVDVNASIDVEMDCTYSWMCSPVGYSLDAVENMFEGPSDLFWGHDQTLSMVQLNSVGDLKTFLEQMDGTLNFGKTYADTQPFTDVIDDCDEVYFKSTTLFLVYITEKTSAIRHEIEGVRKSENRLSIEITTSLSNTDDGVLEGWIMAIGVPREQIKGITGVEVYTRDVDGLLQTELNAVY